MPHPHPAIAALGSLVIAAALVSGCPCPPVPVQPEAPAQAAGPAPREVAGPPTADLVRWLSDPSDADDPRKRFAATLLGLRRDPVGVDALLGARLDRSPTVRAAVLGALGRFATDGALNAVVSGLDDHDPHVRGSAIRALSAFAQPRAMDRLVQLTKTAGPDARIATLALAQSGRPAAEAALATVDLSGPARFATPSVVQEVHPGRIWYVDASAGDDAQGGIASSPLLTLGAALERLRPGDWIHATSGDPAVAFREHVVLPSRLGGSLGSPTVFGAWPGRPPPILDGLTAEGRPGPGIGIQVEGAFVRVEGWTIRGFDESGIHLGGAFDAAVDCTVERCERHGIFAYYAPYATIVRPTVRDCAAQGISLRSSPFAVVSGGSSRNNGIDGLLLLQESDDVTVTGFTASGNQRGVGLVARSNHARLIDLDVRGNHAEAVGIDAGCDVIEFGVRRE